MSPPLMQDRLIKIIYACHLATFMVLGLIGISDQRASWTRTLSLWGGCVRAYTLGVTKAATLQ